MGLHIHYPPDLEPVRQLARAGKLAGLTIIDDTGFANDMVGLVPYVVLRKYGVEHQGYVEYGAVPGVIYQFDNEQNMAGDNNYYMDIMQTADLHNRKVVIFNDSVGWTEDNIWLDRREALRYCVEHGHYVGLHLYGDVTMGDDNYRPMIDPERPDAFRWFTGRVFHLYGLTPDLVPNFIATEAGAGGFQRNATPEQWIADVRRMNAYLQKFPWFKSFNLWDYTKPGMGFDKDIINDYVHQLL